MSLQSSLNQELFNHLPLVKAAIASANLASDHNANQMQQITLQAALNACTPVASMTEQQLNEFQEELIALFTSKDLFE